jgi:hypothetical protein
LRASVADRSEAAGAEALRDEARADRDRWRKLAEKELADLPYDAEPRKRLGASAGR